MKFYGLQNNVASIIGNFRDNKQVKKEIKYWEYNQFIEFINGIEDIYHIALFSFLYYTGVRKGELMAITWKDIDLKNGYIKINKTLDYKNSSEEYVITSPKTKRSNRKVLMPNKLKEIMLVFLNNEKKYKNFSYNWFVFRGLEPIKSTTLKRYFDKYKPSNLPYITIHQFRHSHASLLISQGADVNIVAERLGHTPEMCLNVYSHMWESRQKEILNLIDNL